MALLTAACGGEDRRQASASPPKHSARIAAVETSDAERSIREDVATALLEDEASAEGPPILCSDWPRADDESIRQAVDAVFGREPTLGPDENCEYPFRRLDYDGLSILTTIHGVPWQAAHVEPAILSAHLLTRHGDDLIHIASHEEFGSSGSFGALKDVRAVEILGRPAIAVEGGGMWQGWGYGFLEFFRLADGRLSSLKTEKDFCIDYSEPVPHDNYIRAKWTIIDEGASMIIDYEYNTGAGEKSGRDVWAFSTDGVHRVSGPEDLPACN